MRIRQRRLLVLVVGVALAASVLPFPGSAPMPAGVPRAADQALARQAAPALSADGY